MDFWVTDGRHPEGDDEAWMHYNVVGQGAVGQGVVKLTDDFLHATGQNVFFTGDFLEGGGLFERRG